MFRRIEIHPSNPQVRAIRQCIEIVRAGGIMVYPTDTCYALGCVAGEKNAQERIRAIRGAGPGHFFTLMCRDLSELATYARVDNSVYRVLRSLTPGPYVFVLKATRETPRRLLSAKSKTVGLRVPDHVISQALLAELDSPLLTTTLLNNAGHPISDPLEIEAKFGHAIDLLIDGGDGGIEPSTVIDFSGQQPQLIRTGLGSLDRIPGLELA